MICTYICVLSVQNKAISLRSPNNRSIKNRSKIQIRNHISCTYSLNPSSFLSRMQVYCSAKATRMYLRNETHLK